MACHYCGSSVSVTVDPRALAAGISADSQAIHAGFEKLLATFLETLPCETSVRESGLFTKKVTGFDVILEEFTFRLTRTGSRLHAERITTIRGITLKTEALGLEAWLTSLAEKLSEMAGASDSAREAFSRIAN